MLKTKVGAETWLIRQPDHARVSGFLAAHWGRDSRDRTPGAAAFARPGFYAPVGGGVGARAETVFAIAEHDNGWWEWEADPELDPDDGLPLHLTRLIEKHPDQGHARWRVGVGRFAATRPYAALLISLHAARLYGRDFEPDFDDAFAHPLFGNGDPGMNLVTEATRDFVDEQKRVQAELTERLRAAPVWRAAVEPRHLHPHARLVQVLDALSLFLCFGAAGRLALPQVPRAAWDDRVELAIEADSKHRVAVKPYPFERDPLAVEVPARILPAGTARPGPEEFATWWNALPCRRLHFTLCVG